MKAFEELIYTTEKEVASKAKIHKPKIEAPDVVKRMNHLL